MKKIVLEIPDELLIAFKETPEEFSSHIRMAAAAKLYQMGKLSSGRAAQLAGVSRIEFLYALKGYGVPVFALDDEELKRDFDNA